MREGEGFYISLFLHDIVSLASIRIVDIGTRRRITLESNHVGEVIGERYWNEMTSCSGCKKCSSRQLDVRSYTYPKNHMTPDLSS